MGTDDLRRVGGRARCTGSGRVFQCAPVVTGIYSGGSVSRTIPTAAARAAIAVYIEVFYNTHRRQSARGMLRPAGFERKNQGPEVVLAGVVRTVDQIEASTGSPRHSEAIPA